MKLEDLIEFWNMLLQASASNVVVARDIAEKTLEALSRLENVKDAMTDFYEVIRADLE
jgi:hypothetical protein